MSTPPSSVRVLAVIEYRGRAYRRLESRPRSKIIHVVNAVNEMDWGNYRGLTRALSVETCALSAIGEIRIRLGEGVDVGLVPANLMPFVLMPDVQ